MNKYFIILIVILLIFTTGCSKNIEMPRIEAKYYGVCVKPLVQMQASDNEIKRKTAAFAAGGALAGAIIGFQIGASSSPYAAVPGAIIGALTSSLLVGTITYTYLKFDQIQDENTRFASIRITANQDLSKANRLQLYAYESILCYINEFDNLQQLYMNGKITKFEFSDRFSEIHKAMIELGRLIGNMEDDISRTEREFKNALDKRQIEDNSSNTTHSASKPLIINKKTYTSKHKLSDRILAEKAKVENSQDKNDEDLSAMLEESAGKVNPPKQDAQFIKVSYSAGYSETRQQIQNLKNSHREAMEIMERAASEAGIDMV